MPRIALGIEYDGHPFRGWQSQADVPTVQQTLERAIQAFLVNDQRSAVVCAGRTDTGVHALGQVVHLDTDVERPTHAWVRGVNAHLPQSVAVRWAALVPDDFHARFSAERREYFYCIHNAATRSALLAHRAAWCFRPLDAGAMNEAATCLVGEHDFSSFRSAECQAKTPVKTVYSVRVTRVGQMIHLHIAANAFLHHMVRNIVGSLVYVGLGRKPGEWIQQVLDARDRKLAAPTYDAAGLYFVRVHYPRRFVLPESPPMPWMEGV
ncbi:MAG TPA: tRNA pseudouridine(38-40) synthase TruA [Burkholderiaceae bacterium]|nr:tRNA pseudouridine(38-40) synthase TruA [Burkholderiaceae bacterium]